MAGTIREFINPGSPPNYPIEFKIKMLELSYKPDVSVVQLGTSACL